MTKTRRKKPHVGENYSERQISKTDHRLTSIPAQQPLQLVQKSSWRKVTLKKLVFHIIKVPIGQNSHWGQVGIHKSFKQFSLQGPVISALVKSSNPSHAELTEFLFSFTFDIFPVTARSNFE